MEDIERRLRLLERNAGISRPTPWWWKNPLANKAQQNAQTSTHSAVIQEFATITSDFTTTDTASVHDVITVNIRVPSGSVALFIFSHFAVRHSAGAATFDAYLTLNDGTNFVAYASMLGLGLTTAAQLYPVALVRSASKSDLDAVPMLRDRDITVGLTIQNKTAGTLTIPGGTGQVPALAAFLTGDSSL